MKNKPIILIISIAIISILILAGTIYAYYRSSLIHLSGTIDKDFFPAFGSFVGATMGLLFSIASVILIFYTYQSQQEQLRITRNLVDRQISLSIKPELVIEDFNNYKTKTQIEGEFDGWIPSHIQGINLRIINIGIEAAQYIEYRFEFNIDDLNNYMIENIPEPLLSMTYEEGKMPINLKRVETDYGGWINIMGSQVTEKRGFLLPYKLDSSAIYVLFPYAYIIFYFYTFFGLNKGKTSFNNELKNYPKCFFYISYQDLEGNRHMKKFDLSIEYKGGSGLSTPEETTFFNIEITSKDTKRN
jgi:hypothetical protein